ncbi:MAG: cell wall anchor protein, partial [Phototrophicales bacterium]
MFFACSDDDNPVTPAPESRVLVVHASPDAPGVDLLVDNAIAGSNLVFPNNTGYLTVEAGTRNVKVNVSGTSTTVIEADLNLEADKNYTVFAVDAVTNISALVLSDDLTPPASGNAHVRFVH